MVIVWYSISIQSIAFLFLSLVLTTPNLLVLLISCATIITSTFTFCAGIVTFDSRCISLITLFVVVYFFDDSFRDFGPSLPVLIQILDRLRIKEGMGNRQLHSVFQDLLVPKDPLLRCRGRRCFLFEKKIVLNLKGCNIPF